LQTADDRSTGFPACWEQTVHEWGTNQRLQTADDRSTGFPACWGRPSTNGKRINACSAGTRLFMVRHSLTVRPPMRSSRRGIAFSRNYLPVVIVRWQQGHAGARPRRRRSNLRASRTNVLIASVELETASPPSAARNKAGGQVVAFSRKKTCTIPRYCQAHRREEKPMMPASHCWSI